MNGERYHEHRPPGDLAPLVDCVWTAYDPRPGEGGETRVLPDTCMDILFDFGAPQPDVAVVGTMTRALLVPAGGPVDMLGIRFRAGALSALVSLEAHVLTDRKVALADYGGRWAEAWWEQLTAAPRAARVGRVWSALRVRLRDARPVDPYVRHVVARLDACRGQVRMTELEASTGLSGRQLQRKLLAHVGVTPKALARLARFRAVGVSLASGRGAGGGWAELADQHGFADQAHFIRDFSAFAGVTPARFAAGD